MTNTLKSFGLRAALTAALLVLVAGPAASHHSTAPFDLSRVVRIEGVVKMFRWQNPHAALTIEGTASDDHPDGLWTVEMTAPNVLINEGWKRTSLQAGDEVVMFVNPLREARPLRDGSHGGLYVGVILADGSTLGRTDGKGSGSAR